MIRAGDIAEFDAAANSPFYIYTFIFLLPVIFFVAVDSLCMCLCVYIWVCVCQYVCASVDTYVWHGGISVSGYSLTLHETSSFILWRWLFFSSDDRLSVLSILSLSPLGKKKSWVKEIRDVVAMLLFDALPLLFAIWKEKAAITTHKNDVLSLLCYQRELWESGWILV